MVKYDALLGGEVPPKETHANMAGNKIRLLGLNVPSICQAALAMNG